MENFILFLLFHIYFWVWDVVVSVTFIPHFFLYVLTHTIGTAIRFLAGNKVYYLGGKVLVQHIEENETIGLTHPVFHDLRSRGTGIAEYKGVGNGNDFDGWEFHRATQVAAGYVRTLIVGLICVCVRACVLCVCVLCVLVCVSLFLTF